MKVIKKRFFKPKEETLPSDEVPDPQSSAELLHSLFVPDESEEEETTTSPKTNFEKI